MQATSYSLFQTVLLWDASFTTFRHKTRRKNGTPNRRNFCFWNMAVKRVETQVTQLAGTVYHHTVDGNKRLM